MFRASRCFLVVHDDAKQQKRSKVNSKQSACFHFRGQSDNGMFRDLRVVGKVHANGGRSVVVFFDRFNYLPTENAHVEMDKAAMFSAAKEKAKKGKRK